MKKKLKIIVLLLFILTSLWSTTVCSFAAMEIGITFSDTVESENTQNHTSHSSGIDTSEENVKVGGDINGHIQERLPKTGAGKKASFVVIGYVIVLCTLILFRKKVKKEKH
ncbi:LPXTG cell wall anchor domain-containing protein [Enterococcus sp. CR-Ec1]|uniref:LPXTG cell wall anchor domain-containing protein n=1 Tax=Enterococcus sp. CR-Ec1 TaxID=2057791 RepID=UPI000C781CED|nr:LPXTG cell wall anchor domain-containing protein [Enterococcus sp. CR-Ec1]AUJ87418.1 hypothetical protein CXM95_18445 [Enterococcus sp. CR-Ec1]